jgi:anthranilate synthase component 1
MTFELFQQLIEANRPTNGKELVIPVFKRISGDLFTPVSAFLALQSRSKKTDTFRPYTFLLESVEGGEHLARYSFLGQNPYCVVTAKGRTVRRVSIRDGEDSTFEQANVYTILQDMLNRYEEVKIPELPRFSSGAVGFMGYDTVRLIEHLPNEPLDDRQLPDAVWGFYDTMLVFDHVKHQIILIANAFIDANTDMRHAFEDANGKIADLEACLKPENIHLPEKIRLPHDEVKANMSQETFMKGVEKAKRYIYEGDIFQVVPSIRFEMQFEGDRFNLYRALRQVNPSPYLFYLDFDEFALVGSSPEVHIRMEDGHAELLPIAGTRKRGATVAEDEALAADLLADPKERAEHLMLVDLGRNDLSRVCQVGSVKVEKYAYVERYSHVMHIVSAISGHLADEKFGALDILAATFPAGTLSGSPKVRAMEIIDELEPTKRNIYGGAVGYLDFSGNLDTCIGIRTMIVQGQTIWMQAGAGVVADSDPLKEYEECVNKSMALRRAVVLATTV